MKKAAVLFMVILMAVLCISLAEEGAEVIYSGDYGYVFRDDGTCMIVDYIGADIKAEVPAELDGHLVSALWYAAFMESEDVYEAVIPDTVTIAGGNPYLFSGYSSLEKFTVSENHLSLSIVDGALINKAEKRLIGYPCTLDAKRYAVPDGVTVIGEQAFFECENLEEICFPESLTEIEAYSMNGCTSLREIILPDGVLSIGQFAFTRCDLLTEIVIPGSVVRIEGNPFAGCASLERIVVQPDHPSIQTLDGAVFDKTEKRLIAYPCALDSKKYTIPAGTTEIGEGAFLGCEFLQEIVIPDSVTTIGLSAFDTCKSLEKINIPYGVTFIGENAFMECDSLLEISIPDSVTYIGPNAFGPMIEEFYWFEIGEDGMPAAGFSIESAPDSMLDFIIDSYTVGSMKRVLTVNPGSYAEKYAIENGIQYVYPNETQIEE